MHWLVLPLSVVTMLGLLSVALLMDAVLQETPSTFHIRRHMDPNLPETLPDDMIVETFISDGRPTIDLGISCTFQHIHALKDLVRSVQHQTLLPNNVIISMFIPVNITLDAFDDVLVLKQDHTTNTAKNRNAIIKVSKATYITFVDCTHVMHKERTEIMFHAMKGRDVGWHGYDSRVLQFQAIKDINHKWKGYTSNASLTEHVQDIKTIHDLKINKGGHIIVTKPVAYCAVTIRRSSAHLFNTTDVGPDTRFAIDMIHVGKRSVFVDAKLIQYTSTKKVSRKNISVKKKKNKTMVLTTKNRYGYVKLLADTLQFINVYDHANVHIFDDGSTDFSIDELKLWFPRAHVHGSDHRNPDMSIRHSFEWFEKESDDNILVTIDSDTMLHPKWNEFIDTHIGTSGVLSLYHSAAGYHKSVNCNRVTCEKKSTGSMGMVMTRKVLKDMLHNMHNAKHKAAAFDWGVVKYFDTKNIKIIVPKKSLALHYGMYGAHGSGNHVEVANTFDFKPFPVSIANRAKSFLKNKKPVRPKEFAIIIVADHNAQTKYKDNIENVKCYADHYHYSVIVTDTDSTCKGHFFFKKHCTVRNLMNKHDFKWALVLDGDVAVVNFKRQLTEFVSDDVSVVHGIRFHNNEICACVYFVRNDDYGKAYLDDWVNSGYKGFNYDNGALHYILLDKLASGVSGKEECKRNGQKSRDLNSYDQFVKCVHEVLSRSTCERKVRIMENTEMNPSWIAIDSDRPKGTWTSTSFLHHAMKSPYQLRKAPTCSRSYFEGHTDEWFVSLDVYKKNLKDFWTNKKRRDTGFQYNSCQRVDCSGFKNKWTESLTDKFVSLINKTKHMFKNNNIQWALALGTALGYYRYNDFVPWDDDFDVMVPDESINKILAIHDAELCSVRFWGGCKIFFCNEPHIKGYSWSYPFIDVFRLTQKNDLSLHNSYDTIFPAVYGDFHNLLLPTPKKIIEHLKIRFKDYTTCKSPIYNHKYERPIKNVVSVSCDTIMKQCFN